jgi:hypothetical protein
MVEILGCDVLGQGGHDARIGWVADIWMVYLDAGHVRLMALECETRSGTVKLLVMERIADNFNISNVREARRPAMIALA